MKIALTVVAFMALFGCSRKQEAVTKVVTFSHVDDHGIQICGLTSTGAFTVATGREYDCLQTVLRSDSSTNTSEWLKFEKAAFDAYEKTLADAMATAITERVTEKPAPKPPARKVDYQKPPATNHFSFDVETCPSERLVCGGSTSAPIGTLAPQTVSFIIGKLKIDADGTITFPEGVEPSEAAKEFARWLKVEMGRECAEPEKQP